MTGGGRTRRYITGPSAHGLSNSLGRSGGVKAGIPDLPVSGFPKVWASRIASARYKEGTPGLPVPRIPKGWARRVAL